MKIAPNYRITNIRVNPAGETIEALEINGEVVEMGSAKLENNKAATIDVSTYTEPVEVTPTSGKTGMKKVTVTLDNIPSGGSATAYAWKHSGTTVQYFNFATAPTDLAGMSASKSLESGAGGIISVFSEEGEINAYTRVSDTEFTVTFGATEMTFVRDSTNDFTLW